MKSAFWFSTILRLIPAFVALACTVATAADVRVLAPNAVKDSIVEVVSQFERSTGHKIVISWSGTEAITKRISEGEIADVVINASQNIDRLSVGGKLVQDTRTDFAKSSIGVAVQASVPKPDVSSVEGLRQALLIAKSIVISSGTSGRYLSELFDRLGIGDQIKSKVKQPPSGAQIGDLLARGEAELGFQQVSELIHVKGIQFVGPLPQEIQNFTVYSGAVHRQAPQPDAARLFLQALHGLDAAESVRKSGMEPI